MKKLFMASLLSLASITGFGQPSDASLNYPDCTSTRSRINYYDCSTGAWCGSTDYYCDADSTHIGCETTCSKLIRAACNCPPPA